MTAALFCDQCGVRLPTPSVNFCPACGDALGQPSIPSRKSSFALGADSTLDEESDNVDGTQASHQGISSSDRNSESAPQPALDSEAPASVAIAPGRTSRNAFAYLTLTVVAAFCTWFYFTPHITVNNMKLAAEARDATKFSQYVDYPALRASLKRALTAKFVGQPTGKNADPFAALGASMAAAMIEPVVDELMTPEGLAMLMAGGNMLSAKRKKKSPDLKTETEIDVGMAYESFNRFVAIIREKGKKDDAIGLVFNRDRLLSWRLGEVRM